MSQRSVSILHLRMPIAIVRLHNLDNALEICKALLDGGITTLEFTLTNARANEVITRIRQEFGDRMTVGAGMVLDGAMARDSIAAGAQFLVTPILALDVIEQGREQDIPVISGAYTPTEIWTAWKAGATLVNVFPASQAGPCYFKDILALFPQLKLLPTGGVNLDTCGAFLAAGAYTVAVGSQLIDRDLVRQKDWKALAALAHQYVEACQ